MSNCIVLALILWSSNCNGIILPCNGNIESKVCLLVDNITEYVPTHSPEPWPTMVDIHLLIYDAMGVDEEELTVTLLLTMIMEWNDAILYYSTQNGGL